MSSNIDICNEALSRLAANRINSFDDNTIESNECLARFNIISKQVQSKGPWMCNKIRIQLPQLTTIPTFGFSFAYQLPTDPLCLRVLAINEDIAGDVDFQIENNVLLCNQPTVAVIYMGLILDTTKFDPFLEEAIIDHLTAAMAKKFTGSSQETIAYTKYAQEHLHELLNLSNLQGSPDEITSNAFIDVRFAGSGEPGWSGISDTVGQVGFNILPNDSHNNGTG